MSELSQVNELLARIDERTKNIQEKIETHVAIVKEHVQDDRNEFKVIKGRIFWLTIAVVIMAVVVGGPELVMKLIK